MDGALPVLAFIMLTRAGVSTLYALVAGGVFPAANITRQWVKSRRLDPLGIIVLGFLALGAAASLISGSAFFALTKESFLTATFGLLCLGSLFVSRPSTNCAPWSRWSATMTRSTSASGVAPQVIDL